MENHNETTTGTGNNLSAVHSFLYTNFERAYGPHPLPREGELIFNYGHEFIVRDPRISKMRETDCFPYQFTYRGDATDAPCNDYIIGTGFHGARYGFGISAEEAKAYASANGIPLPA